MLTAALVLAYPQIAAWIEGQKEVEAPVLKTVKYTRSATAAADPEHASAAAGKYSPPVKTIIKYLPPKVTDKEVVEEEEMPTIDEVKQNEVGAGEY